MACDAAADNGAARDPVLTPTANNTRESTSVVVRELRPKQVVAATLLVQGKMAKDVAAVLNVAEETICRWRHRPEFQALMRELLQEHIDAARLGMVSLCSEAVENLRCLMHSMNDETSLKAIAFVLSKVGNALGMADVELRRSPAETDARQLLRDLPR